jgi:hypothetical protein
LITANSFGEDPQEIPYTEFGGGDYVESSEK